MMALVRCLFAHPSVGGAQPTYKSLFYDAFLRRPAVAGAPCVTRFRWSVRRCQPAQGPPAPASGTTLPIARHRFPAAASPLGLPKPRRPRRPLAEGLSDPGPVLPTFSAPERWSGVRRIRVRADQHTPTGRLCNPVFDESDATWGGYRV